MSGFLFAPSAAQGQYFGRNKVEYIDFAFRILATEHFDVYFYPREERAARLAAQMAERWYARFSRLLHHEFSTRQPLVVYGSQAEFAQTNVISGLISDSVGGVTESVRRRIVMPFAPTMAETDRVLGHEIVHAFQFDIGRRHGGAMGLPLWFVEGMAEYIARGPLDVEGSGWLRDAVAYERLPKREKDAARQLSPYSYGHAFWTYLAGRFGDGILEQVLKPGKQRKTADRLRAATGVDLDTLFAEWRSSMESAHRTPGTRPTSTNPRPADARRSGRIQLGPALSPDGRQAVFFSERDRLSLDLYLAEMPSGRIVRKLATTTANAQFDSLQPLRSSGAWSPDGEWFAFGAVRRGQAALMVIDMRGRGRDREIVFNDLGQVLAPTWSPDGTAVAFSALAGGFTDLYVYSFATGHLRQLTDDAFADLQPAWSAAGASLAFATDRFSSDASTLSFTGLELATIDLASSDVNALPATPGTIALSPQWSAEGDALYFVANPDGISNVYRLDVPRGITYRVTDVRAGVGGVTPTSPALSVARGASALAFTVYRNGRYQLEVIDDPAALQGEAIDGPVAAVAAEAAHAAPANSVAGALADNTAGLPAPGTILPREYSSRLSLERLGQPYVSSGGGPFGTFVRAGGSLLFGDMLGERRLGAAVQIGNRLRDAAFELRYLNQERRWNWGAIGELEPALYRYRRMQAVEYEGAPAVLRQADYLQRLQLRAAGLVAYPFSRALRVEFTAGLRHAAYHRELRSQISSAADGRLLEEANSSFSGGVPTTVAEIGAALVGDTAVFGPTGPLVGSRYRFEIAPAAGTLAYTRVMADYRRYFMPVKPYSLAVRLLHSARYGSGGDDPRLLSSFLGSRYLVRGHGTDTRYCQPRPDQPCGDDLVGNRLAVLNLEVRFPLWGLLSNELEYGPLPADGFVFADGGVVWSRTPWVGRTELPVGPRRGTVISSFGAGVRLNAGGLPLEIAAVRALDGPRPRWLFDLGFRVGF